MPAGGKLTLDFEANLSAAMAYERLLALAPTDARGGSDGTEQGPPLPGMPFLLDVSDTAEGEAARALAGWQLRLTDGVITGYYRDETAASPQLQRPWVDSAPVQPIGTWWATGQKLIGRTNESIAQRPYRLDPVALFDCYAPDQSALRDALLDVCRAGISAEHVDFVHLSAAGAEREWRGLPDLANCPLPADAAQIDTTLLKELLVAGAFPDPHDVLGRTPVFYACLHRDAAALHLLLRAGASPQHVPWDRAMLPPLFWAAYFGSAACIMLLLRYGAVPFCEGGAGSHYTLATARAQSLVAGEGYHTLESFHASFCTPAHSLEVAEAVEMAMREAAVPHGETRNVLFD